MSASTHAALEAAIEEHFRDEMDGDTTDERRGAVIINWVVGFTISNVVTVDRGEVVAYRNDWYSAAGDPNAAVALTEWVADDISMVLGHAGDEDN